MATIEQSSPDSIPESVLDDLRLFRDKLLEYANLAGAIMQRKLSSDGHDRRMALWPILSEEYGRLQRIIDEAVIDSEPGTWRGALTPPFNKSTPSSLMRCVTMVSEAIGRLDHDVTAGLRDRNGILVTNGTATNSEASHPSHNRAESLDALCLHQSVATASRRLFLDGHYAQAIFEAFKTVNNFVKQRTGLNLDGQQLMATAFDERHPSLVINGGRSQSDNDERLGFKFLYMGAMTGIRNPKAHENTNQDDPTRTLKYLALASLLVEVAEQAQMLSGGATPRDETA